MKITPDTNILVRAVVRDDVQQAEAAFSVLRRANVVAVTIPCLCEFVWVLRTVYKFQLADIVAAIKSLLQATNVSTDRPAIAAGLALLESGGDFADGVIAYQGRWLAGETFVTFDKQAVTLLTAQGHHAKLLS